MLIENYQYHLKKFGKELLKLLPNLKYLRLFIKLPFHNNQNCREFAENLNQLQYLVELQIISESEIEKDKKPNWTSILKIRPILKKFITVAKVSVHKDKGPIKKMILQSMERTQAQHEYKTQIKGRVLREAYKVDQWRCSYLQLWIQSEPNPFEMIKNIRFSQLKILFFYNDQIETVEALSRMNAPLLQELSLRQNNISSLSSLSKLQSRQLTNFSMNKNKAKEGQQLCRVNWKKLKSLEIECWSGDHNQIQSISFISKFDCEQSLIEIESQYRINESAIAQKLIKKFNALTIKSPFGLFEKERKQNRK